MMNSSTFENLKPYLFGNYLKNSITALLRYVIMIGVSFLASCSDGYKEKSQSCIIEDLGSKSFSMWPYSALVSVVMPS